MEATQKKNKYEIDMCNGTIMDKLISFALPLMVSTFCSCCSMQWISLWWDGSPEVRRWRL